MWLVPLGEPIGEQLYDIQQGCDVLVATSGRFLDILQKDQMNLSRLEFFVLDEADKMMNADFAEELGLILDAIPEERQESLFSATYPDKTKALAARVTSDPVEIRIDSEEPTVESIEQRVIEVDATNRGPLLRQLLKENKWSLVLVFVASKRAEYEPRGKVPETRVQSLGVQWQFGAGPSDRYTRSI